MRVKAKRRHRHQPTPFKAHAVTLVHQFRTALPQVAAVFPHLPDKEAFAVCKELLLLSEQIQNDIERRNGKDPSAASE